MLSRLLPGLPDPTHMPGSAFFAKPCDRDDPAEAIERKLTAAPPIYHATQPPAKLALRHSPVRVPLGVRKGPRRKPIGSVLLGRW